MKTLRQLIGDLTRFITGSPASPFGGPLEAGRGGPGPEGTRRIGKNRLRRIRQANKRRRRARRRLMATRRAQGQEARTGKKARRS